MKLKVLGSSGAEYPGHSSPAFLIDSSLLLDGGTIGSCLGEDAQWKIKEILITHSHLDHIKAIPFLADNMIIKNKRHSITLSGIAATLKALRENLLNDKLWPDFTKISAAIEPVIKLRSISPGKSFRVNGYTCTGYLVNHTVPAVGYIVSDRKGRTLLYTGDTGPTEAIWKAAGHSTTVVIEVSFPNGMEALAAKTGHLTAKLMAGEIRKMKHPPERILITHPKPQFMKKILSELRATGFGNLELLRDGMTYDIES